MNVPAIRAAKAIAEAEVGKILSKLQKDTGLVVSGLSPKENSSDHDVRIAIFMVLEDEAAANPECPIHGLAAVGSGVAH